MAILHSCCCWNNVRSGSLASGIYTLTMSIVNCALIAYNMENMHALQYEQPAEPMAKTLQIAYGWFIVTLVVAILLFLSSILLIIGVHKDNRLFLLPWIAVAIAVIAVDTIVLIYQCMVFGLLTYNIIQMVIWLGLTLLNEASRRLLRLMKLYCLLLVSLFGLVDCVIYCILCVISQYQELEAGRGTMEDIQRQRAMIIYRSAGVQQVHITQGPIVMGGSYPVSNGPTSQTTMIQPTVNTTIIMAPPAYNIAANDLPQYRPSVDVPQDDATASGEQGTQECLLSEDAKKCSPPPPYHP